jgi:hypothetical protein
VLENPWQEFASAIEWLGHCAYLTLSEDHIRREAGKAFADRVEDLSIKIQLLLGGEKTVNEALRQAIELQAMLLACSPQKTCTRTFWGVPVASNWTKRPKTIGVLELWGARPLLG